jgi:hypothetical protein
MKTFIRIQDELIIFKYTKSVCIYAAKSHPLRLNIIRNQQRLRPHIEYAYQSVRRPNTLADQSAGPIRARIGDPSADLVRVRGGILNLNKRVVFI